MTLPCCEFAINNAWNQTTGSTPFFLNFGAHPRSPINVDVVCKPPAADTFVGRVKDSVLRARESLSYAQARMRETADAQRRAEAFEVGEFALLATKGLEPSPLATKKLLNKWLSPFEVIKRVGEVAYELSLPASMSRIHPVFHVPLLRKYKDGGRVSSPPPAVLLDGEEECEIQQVLGRVVSRTSVSLNILCHGGAWALNIANGSVTMTLPMLLNLCRRTWTPLSGRIGQLPAWVGQLHRLQVNLK